MRGSNGLVKKFENFTTPILCGAKSFAALGATRSQNLRLLDVTQNHDYIPSNLIYYTCLELDARGINLDENGFWGPIAEPLRRCYQPRVSFHTSSKLLTEAVRISGDPDLGLSVGLRETIAGQGLLVGALLACETFRQVVELSVRYHPLFGTMHQVELSEEANGDAVIYVTSHPGDPVLTRFLLQQMAASAQVRAKFLYPSGNAFKAVEFSFREGNPSKMAALLGCRVTLGAEVCRMVIDQKILDLPVPTSDPFSLKSSIEVLDRLLETEMERESLLHQVEVICEKRLQTGVGLAEAARDLGMSERSLRRKLEAAGSRFQQILDRVRRDRASEMLLETDLPVPDIAANLGFADARSLRRILVNSTGKTPSEIRRDARMSTAVRRGKITLD